ncbi:MAG TPA: hypothetical protein PKN33_20680 [Phycisphaerae bacterium]|nr:hypothetical protein [Phycisphaerae bacterium]
MADTYSLTCLKCNVALELGGLFSTDENGVHVEELESTGMKENSTKAIHKYDEFVARALCKFLLLHRNHELRCISTTGEDYFIGTDGFIADLEAEDLVKTLVSAESFDPESEHCELESEIRDRKALGLYTSRPQV